MRDPASLALCEASPAPSPGAVPPGPYLLQHVAAFVISREDSGPPGLGRDPVVADGAVAHFKSVPKFICGVGEGRDGARAQGGPRAKPEAVGVC